METRRVGKTQRTRRMKSKKAREQLCIVHKGCNLLLLWQERTHFHILQRAKDKKARRLGRNNNKETVQQQQKVADPEESSEAGETSSDKEPSRTRRTTWNGLQVSLIHERKETEPKQDLRIAKMRPSIILDNGSTLSIF